MQIMRGAFKTCEPCAVVKARQRNVNSKSEGNKAEASNGRVYHNIAIMKESNDDKKLGCKTIWHVSSKEMVNFKISKFFVSKSKIPKYMCEYMESEKVQGHPIAAIRQDKQKQEAMTLAHLED
jgi:hypothetical protein